MVTDTFPGVASIWVRVRFNGGMTRLAGSFLFGSAKTGTSGPMGSDNVGAGAGEEVGAGLGAVGRNEIRFAGLGAKRGKPTGLAGWGVSVETQAW